MPERREHDAHLARRLRIDPTACTGIGICAHLAADLVRIDPWGYPILAPEALRRDDERPARAAIAGCPRKALFIAGD